MDILFREAARLQSVAPHLLRHAALCLSAEDILRFPGRQLHPAFQGEVLHDRKRRPESARVKHRMKQNWIKMYDKQARVLRIETVINQPREFKVLRRGLRQGRRVLAWFPMNKGVANLRHYAHYSRRACEHYLEALVPVTDPGPSLQQLDRLCHTTPCHNGRRRGLNPLRQDDRDLFLTALRGEHALQGFRHADFAHHLGYSRSNDRAQNRRNCARVSRRLQFLRAHGLIARIPRSRRYRLTLRGSLLMGTAVRLRDHFPALLHRSAG